MSLAVLVLAIQFGGPAVGSSHWEAPFITPVPKVDATDFYPFSSHEGVVAEGSGGRSDFVTLIENYLPLQDAYGGANPFTLDPNALYEIHLDDDGDAREDITFQFRLKHRLTAKGAGIAVPVGAADATKNVAIPLRQPAP